MADDMSLYERASAWTPAKVPEATTRSTHRHRARSGTHERC